MKLESSSTKTRRRSSGCDHQDHSLNNWSVLLILYLVCYCVISVEIWQATIVGTGPTDITDFGTLHNIPLTHNYPTTTETNSWICLSCGTINWATSLQGCIILQSKEQSGLFCIRFFFWFYKQNSLLTLTIISGNNIGSTFFTNTFNVDEHTYKKVRYWILIQIHFSLL